MLLQENFTEAHIRGFRAESKRDPLLFERTIYAFGLLEALARSGLPFVFKGGTCLMLLLEKPYRLSTDIDIIVAPNVDIEPYIAVAAEIFPFTHYKADHRPVQNQILKRHFKFTYQSPLSKEKEMPILLDVVFAQPPYSQMLKKEIRGDFLLTAPEYIPVCVPSIACILGDKFTAFAPHTIGILLGTGKDMEVMKQFYDVATLLDVVDDFAEVYTTYRKVVAAQRAYRGVSERDEVFLADTFRAALCIASNRKFMRDEYECYANAIRSLRNHVYAMDYTAEAAVGDAVKIAYATLCLLTGESFERVTDEVNLSSEVVRHRELSCVRHLKKVDSRAYAYVIWMDRLLDQALGVYSDLFAD
jgi:hypothetical protein